MKLKCKDIIFTQADKGNTVIVVGKAEYLNKKFDFLKSCSFKILKRNRTKNFKKSLKLTLPNLQSVILTNEKLMKLSYKYESTTPLVIFIV